MTFPLALLLSLAASPVVPPESAAAHIARFRQEIETTTVLDDARRADVVRHWFQAELSGLAPRSMSDQELRDFFLATLNAASLARDRRISADARGVFDQLEARGLLKDSDYGHMQGLYVRLRAFDQAREFNARYGLRARLEPIPAVTTAPGLDADAPSRFVPAGAGRLRLENAVPGRQDFVLVVADPLCHFTQDAVASIQVDPVLREYFARHSTWLVPDGLSLELDAVLEWNRAFPGYPLALVNDVRDWKQVGYWDTPTFYFFEHGKVVHVVRGWPPEGRADELKAIIGDEAG